MDDLQIVSQEAPGRISPENYKRPFTSTATNADNSIENSNLAFRVVTPATITVENLTLHIDPALDPLQTAVAAFRRNGIRNMHQTAHRKTILSRITARMPSGTLTAVMGASGSGKTFFCPRLRTPRLGC